MCQGACETLCPQPESDKLGFGLGFRGWGFVFLFVQLFRFFFVGGGGLLEAWRLRRHFENVVEGVKG